MVTSPMPEIFCKLWGNDETPTKTFTNRLVLDAHLGAAKSRMFSNTNPVSLSFVTVWIINILWYLASDAQLSMSSMSLKKT